MKQITRYVADDGSQWDTKEEALEREALCLAVANIMQMLPPRPQDPGLDFANGHGYVQRDATQVMRCRAAILDLAISQTSSEEVKKVLESCKPLGIDMGYAHRVLNSSGPIDRALNRLNSIDRYAREWGQVHFALYPDKGRQVPFQTAA